MAGSRRILIDSILGGHSPSTHFASAHQFMTSLGIDPGLTITPSGLLSYLSAGLLRPVPSTNNALGTLQTAPMWIKGQPKVSNGSLYVYDVQGSTYTCTSNGTLTALSDAGEMSLASGNGSEYYDNYMYFAKNTTVARYGPLDGTPKFQGDYWVSGLSKAALTNTAYPTNSSNSLPYPNHVMHRHSDGILYFADVVGNQGVLHTIKTTKTTVEGDTDAGSTFNKLSFGYGLWITALESYGASLVMALFEGDTASTNSQMPAKIGFWDTTSQNFNQIVWVEFPDAIITGIKNIDGIIYVVSGDNNKGGFRVSRYVGGYTFKEVAYFDTGGVPFPGGIDGRSEQLVFASNTQFPETAPCVYSIGLSKGKLSTNGIFNIMRGNSVDLNSTGTCIAFSQIPASENARVPLLGWGRNAANCGIDGQGSVYNTAPSVWWSQLYKMGQRFRIGKIRIPFTSAIAANQTLTIKIYTDDGDGTTFTYQTINSTNYNGYRTVVLNADANQTLPFGDHNFWVELRWTGSAGMTVNLPISIFYDLLDDEM